MGCKSETKSEKVNSEYKHTSLTANQTSLAAGNNTGAILVNTITYPYTIFIKEIALTAIWLDSAGISKLYNYLIFSLSGVNIVSQITSGGAQDNILNKAFVVYEQAKYEDIYISARSNISINVNMYGNIVLNDSVNYRVYIKYSIIGK